MQTRRAGFTLSELMVSLAVLGVISVYLTDMLIRQSRTYEVVDRTTEMQQNVRAIASLLERELRVTGFMVPEAAAICGADFTARSDLLFLTDSDALTMDNENEYDLGAQVVAASYSGVGTETLQVDSVVLDQDPFYDVTTPPDGVADSDFRPGAGVILVDRANPERGAACGTIPLAAGMVSPTTVRVDWSSGGLIAGGSVLGPIPPGGAAESLVAVPAHWYTVNANQLIRDGMVLSDDVEDLQIALFYDQDEDGLEDLPMERVGGTAAWLYDPTAENNQLLRDVRVSFVLRSRAADPEFGTPASPAGRFQVTENRAAPAAPDDQFRRRVFTASVRPRNVGMRGGGA